jgi:integrase/recombinase XerC
MTQALTITTPLTISDDIDVRGIVSDWSTWLKRRTGSGELAASTTQTYRRGLHRFMVWCDERQVDSVSDDVLRDWLTELNESYSPAAVNTWLAGVRSFFVWAEGAGRVRHNPAAGVRGPKRAGTSRHHKRQVLTDDEVVRVMAAPDAATVEGVRDRAILALMAYNGARSVEVRRFDVKSVRTQGDQMVIDVHGKGRAESDEVMVVCHPDAIAAVHDWLAERKRCGCDGAALFVSLSRRSYCGRLSLRHIRHLVKSYYDLAGVVGEGKTTHSLRYSCATNMLRNGAPLQKVQSAMRHRNITTTMIYAHELDRLSDPGEAFVAYS